MTDDEKGGLPLRIGRIGMSREEYEKAIEFLRSFHESTHGERYPEEIAAYVASLTSDRDRLRAELEQERSLSKDLLAQANRRRTEMAELKDKYTTLRSLVDGSNKLLLWLKLDDDEKTWSLYRTYEKEEEIGQRTFSERDKFVWVKAVDITAL